jgi:hypothetical protein
MKNSRGRSKQLVIESVIIAFLLLVIVAGGAYTGLHVPAPWADIQNPASIKQQYDLSGLARYYNSSLTWLGERQFNNVSSGVESFGLLNIPSTVNHTATQGIDQISNLNISIPLALGYLNQTNQSIQEKQFTNASLELAAGCLQANNSESTFAQFENSTTPALSNLGVPVLLYSSGAGLVRAEISSLLAECSNLSVILASVYGTGSSPDVNLTISSPQKTIQTGGSVIIYGNLTRGNFGLAGQSVLFYFNGTLIGTTVTSNNGNLQANLSIPFVYKTVGVIWAFVASNSTIKLASKVSNYLYFTILFNQTQIIIGDPPAYLPTFNFTVSGNLSSKSGVPLPNAPVRITFYNQSYSTTTDTKGIFTKTLTVPANATDGTVYVYAAFAPQGAFGPSFNLTSIQVYHEPINITVRAPSYSLSGFSANILGKVEANGSALADARVTINSPWGTFPATTNRSGGFSIIVPVSIWDFAFGRNLTASVAAAQPYVSSGKVELKLSVFNLLWVFLPVLVLGITVYEARNLDLLPKLSMRLAKKPMEDEPKKNQLESHSVDDFLNKTVANDTTRQSHLIWIYKDALLLATNRFHIAFKDSSTIREIMNEVKALDILEDNFYWISLIVEDYLYSKDFDESRVNEAEKMLAELKTVWNVGISKSETSNK